MSDVENLLECLHCVHFFDCKVKENKAAQCISFEERTINRQGTDSENKE